MADESISLKREHRIDSSDSARPAAQLGDEPQHYAQGLKPKPRVIVSVEYNVLDEQVKVMKGKPPAKLVLKTVTYDDGTTVDTTIGELNEQYQQYLLGVSNKAEGKAESTRLRTQPRKPTTPKKSSKE